MDGGGPALVSQCLEFSKALACMGQSVSLSIKIGSFSFSLDTRKKTTSPEEIVKKKTPSPSTQRRNLKRKQEFHKMKQAEKENSDSTSYLEATSKEKSTLFVSNVTRSSKVHMR